MVENALKGLPREPSLLIGRNFGRRVLSNVILNSLRQYPVEPIVNEIVSLAKIIGLEVYNNDIDELVEEHIQELATAYFTFFIFMAYTSCFAARSYGGDVDRGGGGNN
ncbi:hypothetical protein AVEN_231477-1 [Araneus ventricosus]|uniref:Uncharacterized protein n=1 Tax=Araneus ventricosus TaxID=182803 RepID=A0A4Y2S352_ARAVE|nr:hypothetical protein AVEN_231477-1 [Araneus ventricosus]